MTATIDILGIGNAIVDVLAETPSSFLAAWGLVPGSMALIDAARAEALTAAFEDEATGRVTMQSGGSVANSCAVAACLGVRASYIGKVADDALGRAFRDDIARVGVSFGTGVAMSPATARCLIAITPDGERTMSTFLGAATSLEPSDLDHALIASASITYLEGYLFDPPSAQDAFRQAAAIARRHGRQVALSLSDAFCVERHGDAFRAFVRDHADIVFANEAEITALYGVPLGQALDHLAAEVSIGIVTRSAEGSIVVTGGQARHVIAADPVAILDATGAGDAYAGGFLAALTRGRSLTEAGRLASMAASRTIARIGARPDASIAALAAMLAT